MPTAAKKTSKKSFWEMTDAERDADVRKYDKPMPMSQTRPLAAKERAVWGRMRRGDGPSVSIYVGEEHTKVLIHLDDALLKQANAYAKTNKTTLPKMIEKGLRVLVALG